jgi:hypothetical protein
MTLELIIKKIERKIKLFNCETKSYINYIIKIITIYKILTMKNLNLHNAHYYWYQNQKCSFMFE